ncbi:hypothetical protein [uncultured Methylobacterium sp.]|uniref:hypothetical protein n=1 Tax=uncultured Methylobacterium sp. TaxID=157278 RepID=UPI0035C99F45
MSASSEIFDRLREAAYPWIRAEHRRTGVRPEPRTVDAFLGREAKLIVSNIRDPDLTDYVVSDTIRSVGAYCQRMRLGGYSPANRALFTAMSGKAKEWAKADRRARRAPVDRDGLCAFLNREVGEYVLVAGQDVPEADRASVVERLSTYFARMGAGKGDPLRPASTLQARDLREVDVEAMEAHEAERAEREGRAPRRLSINALHDRLGFDLIRGPDGQPHARDTGITRSAVRGAVERLRGQPLRARRIDLLPPTARDLAGVLECECPQKRVTVVTVDALAAKLWAPARTPAARRQHVRRLRVAGDIIAEAGIGLRLAVVGDHVVVGRGRVLPTDGARLQALVDAALVVRRQTGRNRVRRLSAGLVAHRQGIWGTEEGEIAKVLARTVASHGGHDDAWLTLAAAGLTAGADDMSAVWDGAGAQVQGNTMVLATAIEQAIATQAYGRLSGQASMATSLLKDLVTRAHDAGLDQAWGDLVRSRGLAERLCRASEAGARERVRRIGAVFAKAPIPQAWEAAVLLSTCAARPGRRHKHPPVAMPAARPAPTPAPAPVKAEFYPTHVPAARISGELAEDIGVYWKVNVVRPSFQAMRSVYQGFAPKDTRDLDLDELPQPSTPEAVRDGLRRVLQWWDRPELAQVARIDLELKGALKAAILNAGIALRDQGAPALYYAGSVVRTIALHSRSPERVCDLPCRLAHDAERHRWSLAQAAKTAA